MKSGIWTVVLLIAIAASGSLYAHGIDLEVQGSGDEISGQVRYSDGVIAAGEYIAIDNLDDPAQATQSTLTDAEGRFVHPGVPGTRYRITAHGEEGHSTSVELILGAGPPRASAWPPIYVTLGVLLLLSVIPAAYLRRRQV